MPTVPLPDRPNLEQLKKQARDLQRAIRAADARAIAQVAEHHPDGPGSMTLAGTITLNAAQLVVARRHGFSSWPALAAHVRAMAQQPQSEAAQLAWEFLRLACRPEPETMAERFDRWAQAGALLEARPDLVVASVHAAAAAADFTQVRRMLAVNPRAANTKDGPFGWPPLLYLVCARPSADISVEQVARTAQVLAEAGADLDISVRHGELPYPITVLTGLLGGTNGLRGHGGGDQDSSMRHPLTRELLPLFLCGSRRYGLGGFVYTPETGYRAYRLQDPEPTPDIERAKRASTSAHPDPASWQLITSERGGGLEVIAFRTPEGPVFCELTPTTVTLSPPIRAVAPAGRAALAFHTALGTLGGIVSPEIRDQVRLQRTIDAESARGRWAEARVTDGVFVLPNAFALAGGGLILGPSAADQGQVTVPPEALPAQTIGVVDRPGEPVAMSPGAQRLHACFERAVPAPVVDIDDWVPGLYARPTDRHSVQLGRHGSLLAIGHLDLDEPTGVRIADLSRRAPGARSCVGETIKALSFFYDFQTDPETGSRSSTTRAMAGLVEDERVASITLTCPGQAEAAAVIEQGTFILTSPALSSSAGPRERRLLVRDRTGELIEDLPCEPSLF